MNIRAHSTNNLLFRDVLFDIWVLRSRRPGACRVSSGGNSSVTLPANRRRDHAQTLGTRLVQGVDSPRRG